MTIKFLPLNNQMPDELLYLIENICRFKAGIMASLLWCRSKFNFIRIEIIASGFCESGARREKGAEERGQTS